MAYAVKPLAVVTGASTGIGYELARIAAERGWSAQVWDEQLRTQIGDADAGPGEAVLQLNSSDAVPPAYYLVVVERRNAACNNVSGAWPVGFLRTGG